MTLNGTPGPGPDISELAALAGLEAVSEQFAGLITVLHAEQARRQAGVEISRPAWKNLVFTGAPGVGKSRVAGAVAGLYHDLGLLRSGELIEIAAADLTGATPRETGALVGEAVKATGNLVMITDAHAWHALPDRGRNVLRCVYQQLTEARRLYRHDELAIILAGQAGPLRGLLRASPPLAARFPAVIDFPGYTPGQLAAIFTTLAAEAGFTLTAAATRQAAAVLADAEAGRASGSARLAVRLLTQVTAIQARRVTTAPGPSDPAGLCTIAVADIPGHLDPDDLAADDERPGQYL